MNTSQSLSATAVPDFVDLNFARRLEMAETLSPAYVKELQRYSPDATSEVIAGGTAVFGGRWYPANHIVGMGLYGPVESADLDRVENFYRSRAVPCVIVVSPLADRSLLELLGLRGYRVTEFNSVSVLRLHEQELTDPGTGVTVERVDESTARTWNRVLLRGFAEFSDLPENLFAAFALLPNSLSFLARLSGEPAGASTGAIMQA